MTKPDQPQSLIIGTAGHVDHGKSALVQALTGTDPDRLAEEHRRGISIRLGFAFLPTPEGELAIVDVPGHEGLVREMVAGATGFDAVLFVVAADEGLMPQSREHLEILNLLLPRRESAPGVVALTKIDLVEDTEWLELLEEDLRESLAGTVLEGAPIVRTSARGGDGLDELRERLLETARSCRREREEGRAFRLAADRAFTVEGFGDVVTGTVRRGGLAVGAEIELQPSGGKGRVRNLQFHGRDVPAVIAGQRAAINLAGLPKRGVRRGDEVTEPDCFAASERCDVRLRLLPSAKPLADRVELKLHVGTQEELCRVILLEGGKLKPGADALAQLELRRPLVFTKGDRFILRVPSPPNTVAGGEVIDPAAQRHRRSRRSYRDALAELEGVGAVGSLPLWLKHNPLPRKDLTTRELCRRTGLLPSFVRERLAVLAKAGEVVRLGSDRWLHPRWQSDLVDKLREALDRFLQKSPPYQPLDRGRLKALLRTKKVDDNAFREALDELVWRGRLAPLGAEYAVLPHGALPTEQAVLIDRLRGLLADADPALSLAETAQSLGMRLEGLLEAARYLVGTAEAALLGEVHLWPVAAYNEKLAAALDLLRRDGGLRTADFKQAAGLSRKYAAQFLDHLYERGATERQSGTHTLIAPERAELKPLRNPLRKDE